MPPFRGDVHQSRDGSIWCCDSRRVSVATIDGVSIVVGEPPDPILVARDCGEVYELLGATGPQGEILDLPLLSDSDLSKSSEKLDALGADDSDEVCRRLRSDLEAQS